MTRLFSLENADPGRACVRPRATAGRPDAGCGQPADLRAAGARVVRRGHATLERDGEIDTSRATCRSSPAIACARATAASRSSLPTAPRCTSMRTRSSTSSPTSSFGCSRGASASRSRGPIAATSSTAWTPRPGWAQITAPGEYRVSLTAMRAAPSSSWRSSAARRSCDRGRPDAAGAGERAFARAGAAPSYAYVFNSASWDAFDQWSEARRSQRATTSVQYLPARSGATRRPSTTTALAPPRDLRLRLVSRGRGRLAAVLLRPLGDDAGVWLDVDRPGSLGVADAPLRPLGPLGRRLVLDPGRAWAPAWVAWALRARVRELEPARLEQPAAHPDQHLHPGRSCRTDFAGIRGRSCRTATSAWATSARTRTGTAVPLLEHRRAGGRPPLVSRTGA
jgi:hypothetical protein